LPECNSKDLRDRENSTLVILKNKWSSFLVGLYLQEKTLVLVDIPSKEWRMSLMAVLGTIFQN
jgi:hypothetical protein